jgi:hypothetical protein
MGIRYIKLINGKEMIEYINIWPTIVGSIGGVFISVLLTVFLFREENKQNFDKNYNNLKKLYERLLRNAKYLPENELNKILNKHTINITDFKRDSLAKLDQLIKNPNGYMNFRFLFWDMFVESWRYVFNNFDFKYDNDPYPSNPFSHFNIKLNNELEKMNRGVSKGRELILFIEDYIDLSMQNQCEFYFNELYRLKNWGDRLNIFIKILLYMLGAITFYMVIIFLSLIFEIFRADLLTLSCTIILSSSVTLFFVTFLYFFIEINKKEYSISEMLSSSAPKKAVLTLILLPLILMGIFDFYEIRQRQKMSLDVKLRSELGENSIQLKNLNENISKLAKSLERLDEFTNGSPKIMEKINRAVIENNKGLPNVEFLYKEIWKLRESIMKFMMLKENQKVLKNEKPIPTK